MKPDCQIIHGDIRAELAKLPEKSCHVCVTSPPYWSLRKYQGVEPSVWGGDAECQHEWGDELITAGQSGGRQTGHTREYGPHKPPTQHVVQSTGSQFCRRCSAWRGLLGLEPTIEMYVEHLVECFRAVRRVLRDDGTLWLNCGDSYNGVGGPGKQDGGPIGPTAGEAVKGSRGARVPGLKKKDLIGQPWRVAFALQADGWYLRSALPWVKRSAMPESATDRPTSALEYVFLLTKSPRYFWDAEAVRVKAAYGYTPKPGMHQRLGDANTSPERTHVGSCPDGIGGGRNFRNTDLFFESLKPPYGMIFAGDEPVGLDVTSAGLNEKHFASFPRKLVLPCVLAGTSERGCCPECGAPWIRVLEKDRQPTRPGVNTKCDAKTWDKDAMETIPGRRDGNVIGNRDPQRHTTDVKTLGWRAGCSHGDLEPVASVVCDPFCGSGTSLIVATQQGRAGIGIDASAEYCAMARRRIADPEPEAEPVDVAGQWTFEDLDPEVRAAACEHRGDCEKM